MIGILLNKCETEISRETIKTRIRIWGKWTPFVKITKVGKKDD